MLLGIFPTWEAGWVGLVEAKLSCLVSSMPPVENPPGKLKFDI